MKKKIGKKIKDTLLHRPTKYSLGSTNIIVQVYSKVCTLLLGSAFTLKAEKCTVNCGRSTIWLQRSPSTQILTSPTWMHLKE